MVLSVSSMVVIMMLHTVTLKMDMKIMSRLIDTLQAVYILDQEADISMGMGADDSEKVAKVAEMVSEDSVMYAKAVHGMGNMTKQQ
ncbi:hypothetical protein BDR04DRAFT_1164078 [Suillus decipiens]|nr:hypothetical protein BDR04DRAFT_1164078 [Suillus decipiens]